MLKMEVRHDSKKESRRMNLGFVVLYVDDMAKAKAFYTETLGMTVVDAISSPTFVTLRPSNGSLVALQDKTAARFPPKDETQSGSVELSFEADDVDAVWRRWQEQGVELLGDPVDLPFGRYFMAKDPDGHYLSVYRFAQRPAATPASASQE
jgi:predicted enzyme related to lactoylglutathione lyase